MSGGRFNYIQFSPHLDDAEEEIEKIINDGGEHVGLAEEEDFICYHPETIERFKEALQKIKEAKVYIHRIDWFLSDDDGEKNFQERLKKDLDDLKTTKK